MMPIVVWSRYFLMSQGYGVTQNLLLQDNRSSMLLEKNGRASSGKRTRHINIRYYFITDRVNMKEIEIEWCPTKEMVADFMTKPLQGSHFRRLRDLIMGMTKVEKSKNPRKNVRRKQLRGQVVPPVLHWWHSECATGVCWGLYNCLDRYSKYLCTFCRFYPHF
jgi:hypothetical protein